jgi:hypothetical protein
VSSPYQIFGSQDLKDDDGNVIDSFFIETDAPPNLADAPQPITVVAPTEPVVATRLLTGTIQLTATMDPVQILPADTNRKSVSVQIYTTAASSTAVGEYVTLADENGKCRTSGAWTLRSGKDPYTIIDHTGPIFVQAASTVSANMELTWWAVTK